MSGADKVAWNIMSRLLRRGYMIIALTCLMVCRSRKVGGIQPRVGRFDRPVEIIQVERVGPASLALLPSLDAQLHVNGSFACLLDR